MRSGGSAAQGLRFARACAWVLLAWIALAAPSWARERPEMLPVALAELPAEARRTLEQRIEAMRSRRGTAWPRAREAVGERALPLAGLLRVVLLSLGVLMLLGGACQSLSPRPRFVEAVPAPGSTVASAPAVVPPPAGVAVLAEFDGEPGYTRSQGEN